MAQLAASKRLTSAAVDPAGMVISQMLRAQIDGDNQAMDNVSQANSLLQTADGGLDQTNSILNQMRALTVQAANTATSSPAQNAVFEQQFSALSQALNQTAANTTFGKQNLLDGSFVNQSIQAGANAGQSLSVSISSNVTGSPKGFDAQGLGLSGANLSSPTAINDTLARLDAAMQAVGQQRGTLGAQSNTLTSIGESLATQQMNLAGADSTISDTDYAKASSNLAKDQIITKSGIAMLTQGNLINGQLLKLFG
jgi:flagellin